MNNSCRIGVIFYNNPDTYPPIVNGLRLLSQAGFVCDLVCRDDGERWGVSYPPKVNVQRVVTRGHSSWREYVGFVARVMRRASSTTSVFIGHDMHGLLPARLLATFYRRPLVYHCHDFTDASRVLPLGSRIVRAFEQRFARTADLVIVPDRERAAYMKRALGLKKPPVVVANSPLTRPASSGAPLQVALGERGKSFERIVYRQGRIGAGHGIEATLRSIPAWRSTSWGFVVMGIGEPAYLEELTALAHSLRVEQQFVILPPVSYDRVLDFTPGADLGHALYEPVHINNLHMGTASNKVMEYMAAGLPLLVSNRSSLRALVEKYECGVTADESQPESIAIAINTLFEDEAGARRMAASASAAFDEVFSYGRQLAPVLDALLELAARA